MSHHKPRSRTTPLPKGYQIIKNDRYFYPGKILYDRNGKIRQVSYYETNNEIINYSTRMHALTFLLTRYAEDKGDIKSDGTIQLVCSDNSIPRGEIINEDNN